jgi:hypothetical protein
MLKSLEENIYIKFGKSKNEKIVSRVCPEFFYIISPICRNMKSMTIDFKYLISIGLRELISLQNNLKNVTLRSHHCYKDNEMKDMKDIIPSLIKSSPS